MSEHICVQVDPGGSEWLYIRAVNLFHWFQDSFLFSLAAGLEELVLSEINSPSRSQPTGDSSSVSSFSYKDMMKETQTTNQNKVSEASSPAVLSVLCYILCLTFLQSLKFPYF